MKLHRIENQSYKAASLSKRILAFLIDHIILATCIGISGVLITFVVGNQFLDMMVNMVYPLVVIYMFRDLPSGASFGKKKMKIRVIDSDTGNKPSNYRLIARNIFIHIWPIEALIMLVNKKRLKIGDMIFGTIVVEDMP